uniref:F-box domain-containing protein n=2 Tax=Auxenochlorella protothecoides TaxID=3075 RepID=A0A1D1ZSJ1_AUXPR
MTQPCAANLPIDVLEIVFARTFDSRGRELHAADALRLWGTLLLVCRRWKEALSRTRLELRLAVVDSADAGTLLHQWLHRLELVGLCINSRSMPGNHILMDACSTHDVWVLNEHLIQQPALQHLQDLELILPETSVVQHRVSHLLRLPRLTSLRLHNIHGLHLVDCCPTLQHLEVRMPHYYPMPAPASWRLESGTYAEVGSFPHSFSMYKQPGLRTFRLHVEGDLALQLGQLTHVCEDVSVEATTILLGVEQAEGSPLVDLFSWPYEEGDFVPPHIWGDPAALEASHRACEEACDQMIQRLGQQGPDLKTLRLASDVSLKIIPASESLESFEAYMAKMYPVFLGALPIMYGFQAQGLEDKWSILCGCSAPGSQEAAELARLTFVARGRNDVGITIGALSDQSED